ncbi:hypothetical protein [Pseudomonas solani]|nr:hypothetical protein [Pseudomonas solani]
MTRTVSAGLARLLLTFLLCGACVVIAAFGNPYLAIAIFVLVSAGMKPQRRVA